MSFETEAPVRLSIAGNFPEQFFLENLAVRHDNSLLISVVTRKELYYLPPITADVTAKPALLHIFEEMVAGIAEPAPGIFLVMTTNAYTTHTNHLFRLDLRGWSPGAPVTPEPILTLPKEVLSLNGCCALSRTVVLAADSFGGAIWRFDLDEEARHAAAKLWLKHDSMAQVDAGLPPPPQPGVNGVRYSAALGHLYYTTTGQKLFMRVAVDPVTLAPTGEPEELGRGGMYDDFCLDEARGFAFVTLHRENRLDRLPLAPGAEAMPPLVGRPFDERLIGPSSAAWSRLPGEEGRVVLVTTDGGTTAPPQETAIVNAKVVRIEIERS